MAKHAHGAKCEFYFYMPCAGWLQEGLQDGPFRPPQGALFSGEEDGFDLSEPAKSMHRAVQAAVEDFLTNAEISPESNRWDITSFHMLLGVFGCWILPAVFCAWKCLSQTLRCLSLRLAPRKGQFVIPNWPLIKACVVTCGYNGICMKHSRNNTVPNPDVTIERQPVEDVCPIKHGDFPMSYVSFQGGHTILSKVVSPHHPQRCRVFLLRSTRSIRFRHM